jgi:uncharacterized membrane protein
LSIFDFGIYDWRIWLIHNIPWTEWPEKFKSAFAGHFQPILVVYSILYDLRFEPVLLNVLQAVAVLSGIIPLYLLIKNKFDNRFFVLSIVSFFLLFPATQFNIAIDFHADHLIIPFLFWCYYLVEKEKYVWIMPFFVAGCTLKEPLILAFLFMGIYIAWDKKQYIFGISIFLISFLIFYAARFLFIPKFATFQGYETIIGSRAFGYLFNSDNLMPIIQAILRFEKWRFPFFLLFPLLFLPLLKFRMFLPAVPLLAIPLLSTVIHHQNVASQYTAGIIPPLFVSFAWVIGDIIKKYGERLAAGILSWIGILLIAFNIAHSPSPLAIAFWKKDWSQGKWHYSNYLKDDNHESLKEAINLIPSDPKIKLVTHSMIYDKRLAHRYFYKPFPEKWEEADYILLDNSRGGYIMDNLDEAAYRQELEKVRGDGAFGLIFEYQGIRLFRRVT